jgi:hypothetical protein
VRLVWSQPTRPSHDRARHLLLLSVLCLFLGGTLAGAAGRDPRSTPRAFRAAVASILTTGGVFFLLGVAFLALPKAKKSSTSLSLARPFDPSDVAARAPRFGQEERR